MKRGDTVYFITKGVVRSGLIESQDANSVKVFYKYGKYEKVYTFKRCEIATAIEGGIDVRERFGLCSNGKGINRCNGKNSKVREIGQTDCGTEERSNNVFKGVWAL